MIPCLLSLHPIPSQTRPDQTRPRPASRPLTVFAPPNPSSCPPPPREDPGPRPARGRDSARWPLSSCGWAHQPRSHSWWWWRQRGTEPHVRCRRTQPAAATTEPCCNPHARTTTNPLLQLPGIPSQPWPVSHAGERSEPPPDADATGCGGSGARGPRRSAPRRPKHRVVSYTLTARTVRRCRPTPSAAAATPPPGCPRGGLAGPRSPGPLGRRQPRRRRVVRQDRSGEEWQQGAGSGVRTKARQAALPGDIRITGRGGGCPLIQIGLHPGADASGRLVWEPSRSAAAWS